MLKFFRRDRVAGPAEITSGSPASQSTDISVCKNDGAMPIQVVADLASPNYEKEPVLVAVEGSKTFSSDSAATEMVYPKGAKLVGILFGLCCSVFLVALDQTIIATAIPSITNHFERINDIGWYGMTPSLNPITIDTDLAKPQVARL